MAFSIAVVQKTQLMHHSHDSGHKEHALSNVCYLIPPHLVTHRICNELQKKRHVRCWHGTRHLDLLNKFPLSFVWDSPKAETGSDSFTLHQMASNPSHRHTGSRHGTASKHSHKNTQTHTCIREHFHPIGTALANQYARKPQGLVSHCFQTRPNSSYRKIYCATGGQAAIYFGNKPKRKTRSPCLSKSIREAPKSHKAARFWRASLLR